MSKNRYKTKIFEFIVESGVKHHQANIYTSYPEIDGTLLINIHHI
jgi:hypothetical protein